ncbi:MAG: NAD(P)/FAD-dependent oxidoreductase [Acholeplasmataceae bacterium]|nr:NAD(P)/FAD-dependent oxidoreductase [Acholeplasmataceae bacterium]
MKAIIIGSGLSGLMSAALLAKRGVEVTIYEQNPEIGGVTALLRKNGYAWEQGPLLLGDFLPGEKVNAALKTIGITLETVRGDRGIVMPDFELWKDEEYRGPHWRRERLLELFPEERKGLRQYYRFYDALTQLVMPGISKIKQFFLYLKVKKFKDFSAQDLMNHFFKNSKLQTVFTGILADFCAKPSEFPGFIVPFVNLETAFDVRIPLEEKGKKIRNGFCYIKGGVEKLVQELAKVIYDNKGKIETGRTVAKILVEENKVKGVRLENGEEDYASLVIASGGGKEVFYDLVGKEHLDQDYLHILQTYRPMESIFMVHLGVDFDPLQYQKAALCYYYKTYDLDGAVEKLRNGIYHEGDDGFLIYVPSFHSPEMAPQGHHAVTIYTVAPDTLKEGSWEELKEKYADKLIALAEAYLPDLRKHIKEKVIMTPVEYRKFTHLKKSAFGGVVPIVGVKNPPHKTPVAGLYFVGQQSENAGGVAAVLMGAIDNYHLIEKDFNM